MGSGRIRDINRREKHQPRFCTGRKVIMSQEYEVAMAAMPKEKDGSEVRE